jgi:hypothetical protein
MTLWSFRAMATNLAAKTISTALLPQEFTTSELEVEVTALALSTSTWPPYWVHPEGRA